MTSADWRGTGSPRTSAVQQDLSTGRNVGKWTAGAAFFLALALLAVALQLFQMSAEGNAKRTLRQSIAALTEVDALVARDYAPMQERAADAEPDDPIILREFPIAIDLTVADVRGASEAGVRDAVLARAADRMYDDGAGVLRDEDAAGGDPGMFTAAGVIKRWLGLLTEDRHTAFGIATFVLAALSAFLAVTLGALCRGGGRIGSVGLVVLLVAVPMTLLGWLGTVSSPGGEYVERELLRIGEELARIPIRNGLAMMAFGAALLVAGVVVDRVGAMQSTDSRQQR